ncbi:MAG TPA: NADH-quinone oxidoreductase subunit E [Alphaproteobacteria bacterium]|nr:NADH-quinone oxidoreductase subunit E [Alphaproteobacteria bacterium]
MDRITVDIVDVANEYKNSKNEHYKSKMERADQDFKWSKEQLAHIETIKAKYPDNEKGKKSTLLPLLHYAQDEFDGWLPVKLMQLVADTIEMPLIKVQEVATFYTMFNLKPVGKYHLQVCTNCACMVTGSGKVLTSLKEEVGEIEDGMSKDGLFTITEVECLGACIQSPVVQVNKAYKFRQNATSAKELVQKLKAKG